ncbi:MAG TPA: 3-hydroxyacyl-[acyl-carrier-protein] dehydratase FabZ [Candidatus Omnitrophica bacterium]|nr:3-hydroxyacyl-[acyl-carrier-protein] dehydratase FabZ [Candidatus Omnitrophota bacterium]
MNKILETEDIKKLIPQRYPFLMLDRVIEASPEKVVAIKNVSINESYFSGHFPDQKVMPGVLMIEAMAQAGIILYKQKFQNDNLLYLVSVKSRFFSPVVPGDQLRIEVTSMKMLSKMGIFKAETKVGDKKIAEAEIAFGSQEARSGL